MKKYNSTLFLFVAILAVASFLAMATTSKSLVLKSEAVNATTSVTVVNDAPTFSVAPAQTPDTSVTPVNVSNAVNFAATGTDANSNNYYLLVCTGGSTATANAAGGAPTCTGGTQYCVSGSTASGTATNCNYTVQQSDPNSPTWVAFVCDAIAGSKCSAGNSGTGVTGSPFNVNHRPVFTAITPATPSAIPGASVAFNSTASDADSGNTIKLIVCATSGATTSGCTGTQLCTSSLVSTNPTCSYTIPNPTPSGNLPYFAYIFDNRGLGASTNPVSGNYTVSNDAPTISGLTLNGNVAMNLTESTTTAIPIVATISDKNTCHDLTTVTVDVYESSLGCTASDPNSCYKTLTCTLHAGNCQGALDLSAQYDCTANIQYHGIQTTTNLTTGNYVADTWVAKMTATDAASATGQLTSTGVEMNVLLGIQISSTVAYGSLSSNTTSATSIPTSVTATGNVGLDSQLNGTDLTSGGNSIPVGNQRYSLTNGFTFGTGTALTTSLTSLTLGIAKTSVTATPASGSVYWKIQVPANLAPGSYSGTTTMVGVAR